jgi:hypothetical protein
VHERAVGGYGRRCVRGGQPQQEIKVVATLGEQTWGAGTPISSTAPISARAQAWKGKGGHPPNVGMCKMPVPDRFGMVYVYDFADGKVIYEQLVQQHVIRRIPQHMADRE